MKIVMVIGNYFPPVEGVGFHIYNLSKKLIEKGHSVTVITRGSLKTEKSAYDGINIIRAPYLSFLPLYFYPFLIKFHSFFLNRLFKTLEKEYDILHLHLGIIPLVNTNLPILTTMHGSIVGDIYNIELRDQVSLKMKILTKYFTFPLVSKIIKNSDIVTTVSKSVANELEEYYGLNNVPICGNAIDEKMFKPSETKEENYVLYVGGLRNGKGILDLIKAYTYFSDGMDLFIAGQGPLEAYIQKFIKENNINNIKLLGQVSGDNLVKLYQNATMFVFPSHYEGLPTVLLEAMACGLPVMATNIPSHKELIEDYENGLFIEKDSPEDIIEKIEILINDKALRNKLGKNARRTVLENYTWDIVVNRIENYYKNIFKKVLKI